MVLLGRQKQRARARYERVGLARAKQSSLPTLSADHTVDPVIEASISIHG